MGAIKGIFPLSGIKYPFMETTNRPQLAIF